MLSKKLMFGLVIACLGGASVAQAAGDAAAGKIKTENLMCNGCHGLAGVKTAFPEVYSVPKLGGQHAEYIIKALQGYKSGDRSHPSMVPIAKSLSDKEMADIAAYYTEVAK